MKLVVLATVATLIGSQAFACPYNNAQAQAGQSQIQSSDQTQLPQTPASDKKS